jgi:DNA-binding CsgD family transcriptional regulator
MLVDLESISRRTNVYLQQSFATRFPVHDAMIHSRAIEHQRSPEGLVLSRHGFEHCLFTLLLRSGRPVGTATVARRTGRPPFTPQELAVAHRLGGFLSIALANAVTHARGRSVAKPLAPPSWSDEDTQTLRLDGLRAGEHDPAAGAGVDVTEVLTKREREVLVLAMSGLQDAEIAIDLGIATNTVKQHMKHIFRKPTHGHGGRRGAERLSQGPAVPGGPPRRTLQIIRIRTALLQASMFLQVETLMGGSPTGGTAHRGVGTTGPEPAIPCPPGMQLCRKTPAAERETPGETSVEGHVCPSSIAVVVTHFGTQSPDFIHAGHPVARKDENFEPSGSAREARPFARPARARPTFGSSSGSSIDRLGVNSQRRRPSVSDVVVAACRCSAGQQIHRGVRPECTRLAFPPHEPMNMVRARASGRCCGR